MIHRWIACAKPMKIHNHLLTNVQFLPSDNCDDRRCGEISLIVVHCISLPEGHFATGYVEQLFCNQLQCSVHGDFGDLEGLRVSSHVLVRRDGSLVQFVPFDRRAWHAGASSFEGRDNCNDFAVGIELEGTDHNGYRDAQYTALIEVCRLLVAEYAVPVRNIVGHSDIAPGRKSDPGPFFDWPKLRQALLQAPPSTEAVGRIG